MPKFVITLFWSVKNAPVLQCRAVFAGSKRLSEISYIALQTLTDKHG